MVKSIGLRRAAFAVLRASFVAGFFAAAPVPAAADEASAPWRFRAIKVDVSPLVQKGLGPEASWMAADLPSRLQAVFAGHIAPRAAGAPTLVVRIDQVYLGASGGGGTQPLGDYGARDGIEGVGMVVAPNGKVVATYPLFSSLVAFTGGSVYDMSSARGRVAVLASSFAQWLPGKMGL